MGSGQNDIHAPSTVGAGPRADTASAVVQALLVFLLFTALSVLATWPFCKRPATHTFAFSDTFVNLWSLAWVVHQAQADPLHLFDSNAYHPHPQSLAYAESMLPQSAQAAPVLLAGGSPILAYNLVLFLTFPLSGLGAYFLARELTEGHVGPLLAGLGYAFSSFRINNLIHIQVLSGQWFPFAILFLLRALKNGRRRDLLGLVVFTVLQTLSSAYYAVFLAIVFVVLLLWKLPESKRSSRLAPTLTALVLAGSLTFLAFLPQAVVQIKHGLVRSRAAALNWSADWASYLTPSHLVRDFPPYLGWLFKHMGGNAALYPGLAVIVLGAVGLAAIRKEAPARLACVIALTGVVFSLGPEVSLAGWSVPGPFEALRALPGVNGLRVPSRMGIVALLGFCLLAAIGWSKVQKGLGLRPAFALVPALLILAEAHPGRLPRLEKPVPPPPEANVLLAQLPRGPVLELPWDHFRDNALYLYWSTAHWQPMINGYGAFEPPGNVKLGQAGRQWPKVGAARVLRKGGVRYVLIHGAETRPEQRARLEAGGLPSRVSLVAHVGSDWLYRIDP